MLFQTLKKKHNLSLFYNVWKEEKDKYGKKSIRKKETNK